MCDSCIPLLSTSVRLALTEEAKEENAFDNRAGARLGAQCSTNRLMMNGSFGSFVNRRPTIYPPPVTPSFLFLDSIPLASRRFHHQK
jgi:hypothetical protein